MMPASIARPSPWALVDAAKVVVGEVRASTFSIDTFPKTRDKTPMGASELTTHNEVIEKILEPHRATLGGQYVGYRNHAYRMINFVQHLSSSSGRDEVLPVMVAFHDLPFVLDGNLDYLGRADDMATAYLIANGLEHRCDEIRAMIDNHHKIRAYTGPHRELVEAVRKADWIDVTFGLHNFGIDRSFIKEVAATFPLTGFYPWPALGNVTRYAIRHPLRPLPLLRW